MKLVLRIQSPGEAAEQETVFDRLPILIGRSRICDLVINDPILSRQHCILELENNQLYLGDLESANGTMIDGKPIDRTSIQEGEAFKIGDTEISLVKVDLFEEETTVHDLEPAEEETTAPKNLSKSLEETKEATGRTVVQPEKPQEAPPKETPSKEAAADSKKEITPSALRDEARPSPYQSKEWVQVSLFWKGELINMTCFEQGDVVSIGKSAKNDFVVNFPSLPDHFRFLKIAPQGVEMHLHHSMKGEVETRSQIKSIDELRSMARQTELGLSTFIPFQDRCLIEIGPFAIFIRTVRLTLKAPLTAPLIREPFFTSVASSVAAVMVTFLFALTLLPQAEAEPEEEEEDRPVVRLEAPQKAERVPPPPKVKPQPKPKPKKAGPKKQKATKTAGGGGAGAKAAGPSGKRGNVKGTQESKSRPIGFKTRESRPRRVKPKGAFGDVKEKRLARRNLRKSQGSGTGSEKKSRVAKQAPSPKPKPKVRVEDQGILGVIGSDGGGGSGSSGGVLEGSGLGGELEGGVEGLAQGGAVDSRGAGGRGSRGRSYGGGGDSLNVGGLATRGKGGGQAGFGLGSSGRKGESEVNFVIEDVEVRDGLTREEIRRVVESNQNQIQACWDKYIIDQGVDRLSVTMTIDWFVNRSGRAVNIQRKSGSGHASLYRCISRSIASWRFPEPRGGSGAQVRWPWTFNH